MQAQNNEVATKRMRCKTEQAEIILSRWDRSLERLQGRDVGHSRNGLDSSSSSDIVTDLWDDVGKLRGMETRPERRAAKV